MEIEREMEGELEEDVGRENERGRVTLAYSTLQDKDAVLGIHP